MLVKGVPDNCLATPALLLSNCISLIHGLRINYKSISCVEFLPCSYGNLAHVVGKFGWQESFSWLILDPWIQFYKAGPEGHFKNTYELVNLGAHKVSLINKLHIFQCMGKIFNVNLWNSTQNILPTHWKRQFLVSIENLETLRFIMSL